ncbi:MAG TPA: aminotransferase class I/II-fold pyridoxal phosphate-dependent enzyme, partial [Nitrospirae bacterium]|nr:aminotransferase class I/II-fold pyridoxal phosphate-dependent enzyme [Nitrospirota bacterium]
MDRFRNVSPFIVMDILDRARRMEDVIHLEVGEPDLDAPPGVIEAFEKAVRDGKYRYTPALGLMELRETISGYYKERYGVNVSPERVAVTPGTSGAFLIVYAMLLNSGDKIALSNPAYPCYRNFSYILDADPVFVALNADNEFCIGTDELEGLRDIKAVQVSTPSNPVGNIYGKDRLSALIDLSRRNDISFICDEIYHGLVYDRNEHTALEFDDNVIVINGFSKYFCMPGFRIGWVILPAKLVRKAEMAIQNIFIAANTPAQYAAVNAFDGDYLGKVRAVFRERRDYLFPALSGIFSIPVKPEGAFYIWADVSKYGLKGSEFAEQLLEKHRV